MKLESMARCRLLETTREELTVPKHLRKDEFDENDSQS